MFKQFFEWSIAGGLSEKDVKSYQADFCKSSDFFQQNCIRFIAQAIV